MSNKTGTTRSRLKDTISACTRLLALVWSINKLLFSVAITATIIPSIVPFINIYIYKLIIDIVVAAIQGTQLNYTSLGILLLIRIITYFLQDVAWRTQEYVERLLWTKLPIRLDEIIIQQNLPTRYTILRKQ